MGRRGGACCLETTEDEYEEIGEGSQKNPLTGDKTGLQRVSAAEGRGESRDVRGK